MAAKQFTCGITFSRDEDWSLSSGAKGLAGRYAVALYALANDAGKVESVVADLTNLAVLITENAEVKSMVGSPAITWIEQMNAITAILEKAGADALTVKFAGRRRKRALHAMDRIISVSRTCPATWRNLAGHLAVALDKSGASLEKLLVASLAMTNFLSQCALIRP